MIREDKGITLLALVITIIILLILASISIVSGTGAIDYIKFTSAKSQISTIQTNVNSWYQERQNNTEILNYGQEVNETNCDSQKLQDTKNRVGDLNQYRYFSADYLKNDLGIDGISYDFLIDIDNRSVILFGGITYQDEPYFFAEDFGIKNVSYEEMSIEDYINIEMIFKSNTTLKDENGDSITVPANFNLAKESPDVVTEGIVIEDNGDNQYVWIPVFEKSDTRPWGVDYTEVESTAEESDEYYTAIQIALKQYTKDYADTNTNIADVWKQNTGYKYVEDGTVKNYTNGNLTEEEYTTLYHNMLKSVYENGGFYIGRYEMGIKVADSLSDAQANTRTGMNEYVSTNINENNTAPSIDGMVEPVSKANAVPYNYITQSQAQMLAEKVKDKINGKNVTSSLMFGVQWDAVCVYIEHFDTRNTQQDSKWLKDNNYNKDWGNYSNSSFIIDNKGYFSTTTGPFTWQERTTNKKAVNTPWACTTGASNQNSSLSIYDFAGNLGEWTLETPSSGNDCMGRGGYMEQADTAWQRSAHPIYAYYSSYTSRVAIFIND